MDDEEEKKSSALLALPTEVRQMIWEHLLVTNEEYNKGRNIVPRLKLKRQHDMCSKFRVFHNTRWGTKKCSALLQVNRQIHDEVFDTLFRCNRFLLISDLIMQRPSNVWEDQIGRVACEKLQDILVILPIRLFDCRRQAHQTPSGVVDSMDPCKDHFESRDALQEIKANLVNLREITVAVIFFTSWPYWDEALAQEAINASLLALDVLGNIPSVRLGHVPWEDFSDMPYDVELDRRERLFETLAQRALEVLPNRIRKVTTEQLGILEPLPKPATVPTETTATEGDVNTTNDEHETNDV